MELNEILAKMTGHAEAMDAIADAADAEGRDLTEAEQAQVDEHQSSFDKLKATADRKRAAEARAAEIEAMAPQAGANRKTQPGVPEKPSVTGGEARNDASHEAFAGFEDEGHFFSAVVNAGLGGERDARLAPLAAATGMGSNVGPDGGFLVPHQMASGIWNALNNDGVSLLARTPQLPITGGSLTIPAVKQTSKATGSLFGGVDAYWTDEGSATTASKPQFREIVLRPRKLTAAVYVSEDLRAAANAPALNQMIADNVPIAMRRRVNDAIYDGSGVGQPLGLLDHDATVVVAKESGQSANTILAENVIKMYSRMLPEMLAGAVWLINPDVMPELMTMTIGTGTAGMPVFVPQGGLSGQPFATLMGKPVLPIDQCETLGTKGDIMLVNLRGYATGVRRGGIRAAESIHVRFLEGESVMRFTYYVDGQPYLESAVSPAKGNKTQSTFVALADRS